jgi:hypothetical protein
MLMRHTHYLTVLTIERESDYIVFLVPSTVLLSSTSFSLFFLSVSSFIRMEKQKTTKKREIYKKEDDFTFLSSKCHASSFPSSSFFFLLSDGFFFRLQFAHYQNIFYASDVCPFVIIYYILCSVLRDIRRKHTLSFPPFIFYCAREKN